MQIHLAQNDSEIMKCFKVLNFLRPHLDKETFLSKIRTIIAEGYHLAYIEEEGNALAVIGFRFFQMLYTGKQLYIDDLSTLEAYQRKGYATALLNHVLLVAQENKCEYICLDSGYHRQDAHKLYLKNGFILHCHHLSKKVFL